MRPEQRLSAFVAGLRWGDVPPPVARKVVDHALDAVGVMCAGRSAPSSIPVRTLFTEAGGVAEASVIGGATALPAPAAAFVNAFHGRVHTFDDTYDAGPIHPGSVVLAAALAAAERRRASGADLLAAVLAGCEVSVRVSGALGPDHYASGFHGTGTCNALGAAAAAARAMGLDADAVAGALGHAGAAASGLRQYQVGGSMSDSALNGARAAHAGVVGALLAADGLPGPAGILSGPWGVCNVMSPGSQPARLVENLGRAWAFVDTALKAYPTCRFTHGPIAALLALRRRHDIDPATVDRVDISGFRRSIEVSDRPIVETRFDALMSHQFAAAAALARGRVSMDSLEKPVRADPLVRRLMARVRIRHDPSLDAAAPAHWPHRVQVTLADGSVLEADSPNPPGSAGAPIPPEVLEAKFRDLTAPILGEDAAERVRRTISNLARIADIGDLGRLLRPGDTTEASTSAKHWPRGRHSTPD